jgi:hypothetical protein
MAKMADLIQQIPQDDRFYFIMIWAIRPFFIVFVVLFLSMQGPFQNVVFAQIDGDVKLLERAAIEYRSNLENIKTWKGKVKCSLHSENDKWDADSEWTAEYACDFLTSTKRWEVHIEKDRNNFKGKESVLPPSWRLGLYQSGACYELQYDARNKNGVRLLEIRNKFTSKPDYNYATFDAEFYLGYQGEKPDVLYEALSKGASGKEMSACSIRKEGDNVVLRLNSDKQADSPLALYNFDLSKGANLTRVEMRRSVPGDRLESIWTWSWKKIGGAWVPDEVTKDSVVMEPSPSKRSVKMRWIENEVNVDLEKDEFSLVKLGARQGDAIQDYRTNERRIVTYASYPTRQPEAQPKTHPKPQVPLPEVILPRKNSWGPYVATGVLVCLAILMGSIFAMRAGGKKRNR